MASGWEDLVIAGGVESMSRVAMGSDGGVVFTDPTDSDDEGALPFVPQGISADLIAALEGFTRVELDSYALRSQQRAAAFETAGHFDRSVVPVKDDAGTLVLERDVYLRPQTTPDSLAQLPPAFERLGAQGYDRVVLRHFPQAGTVAHLHTAGNSSGIVDGAALVMIGSGEIGAKLGVAPRARILATALVGTDPVLMLTDPAPATRKALAKAGMMPADIDLFEVNEAFAAVALKFLREMGMEDGERVNVNGGAIA